MSLGARIDKLAALLGADGGPAADMPHHEKVRRLQHTIISIAGRPRPRPVNTHALARACYPHFDLPEDTDPDDFYDGVTAGKTANHAVVMRGRAPTRGVHHSSSLEQFTTLTQDDDGVYVPRECDVTSPEFEQCRAENLGKAKPKPTSSSAHGGGDETSHQG